MSVHWTKMIVTNKPQHVRTSMVVIIVFVSVVMKTYLGTIKAAEVDLYIHISIIIILIIFILKNYMELLNELNLIDVFTSLILIELNETISFTLIFYYYLLLFVLLFVSYY